MSQLSGLPVPSTEGGDMRRDPPPLVAVPGAGIPLSITQVGSTGLEATPFTVTVGRLGDIPTRSGYSKLSKL